MKKQVVIIHGGDTFEVYDKYLASLKNFKIDLEDYRQKGWKSNLQSDLGEDFDVILPEMPNSWDARYIEWKIIFEKILALADQEIILVGHSLGGSFLAKYLSENKITKKVKGVLLVAACYDKDVLGNGLHSFSLPTKIELPTDKVYLYHSKDDNCVPFADLELFKQQLPNAMTRSFEDRGHFHDRYFPELVADIKSL